jgi:uncharacterized membrane protein
MDIVIGFFCFLLALVVLFSGSIALVRTFLLSKRTNELLDQNAKLESALRRLQLDVQNLRTGNGNHKDNLITLEPDNIVWESGQPPAQHEQPAKPVYPAVPFAATAAPPLPSKHDADVRQKSQTDTGIFSPSGIRTTADWTQSAVSQAASDPLKPNGTAAFNETSQSLELWIGRKLFGWIAVAGFIVAAALLIRYAVQAGWIGPGLKVAGIAVFGTALLGLGFHFHRTGLRRFSTMMSSAGIIIIFQAGYASFAYYHLVSNTTAGIVMPIIVLGGFLLSWFYRSKLLGIVSVLGGLAVPVLISSKEDLYQQLFVYLILLNIGTVMLINLLRRVPIAFLAFFGSQFLFWFWFADFYEAHKLAAVLLFQSAFYAVYLSDTAIATLTPMTKKTIPTWDDAMRAVIAPIILFGSLYIFAKQYGADGDPPHQFLDNNLGYFAFIGAIGYALLAVVYSRYLTKIWNGKTG